MQTTGTFVTLSHPTIGVAPVGFQRVHVEMLPAEIGRVVGYDPRALVRRPTKPGGKMPNKTPHNVSIEIVDLQNSVQRSIDSKRVSAMVDYLVAAMDRGAFADWGPIELVTSDGPDLRDFEDRHLAYLPGDADYFIADGQHRYCALLDFARENPGWADRFTQLVTISVVPHERLAEWAGQEFHDRNYYPVAVRPGKALSVDSREPLTVYVKSLVEHPVIIAAGGLAFEKDTITARDPRFTSLSVMHRFVRAFLLGRPGLDRDGVTEVSPEARQNLEDYLTELSEILPWASDSPDRPEYLTRASVMLSGLGVLGHDIYEQSWDAMARHKALAKLGKYDWRRTNLSLVGVVGSEKPATEKEPAHVQPASGRQAIDGTIRLLRQLVGVGAIGE